MKVLFIGGTGLISAACSNLAIERGIDLYHINRGKSVALRPVNGAKQIEVDIRNFDASKAAIRNLSFDAVVDWISFLPEHLESNLKLFANKTKQFVFISSASAYQTPPKALPITENTPLDNPIWQYSKDKMACEVLIKEQAKGLGLDYTIVRPSHTYDKYSLPLFGGYTTINRMLQGKAVAIPGDGSSIWTLTHHSDFAKGLVGLLGNPKALNEDFHITAEEWITWGEIFRCFTREIGVNIDLVGIPSAILASFNKDMGDSLLGDKCHSMIFDNTKIKAAVPDFECSIPFEEGVKQIVDYYLKNPAPDQINLELDSFFDQVISKFS